MRLTPSPIQHFHNNDGTLLVDGKLYTYAAGGTTPLATYTDSTGGTEHDNPIILDARGEAAIWLTSSKYKFALHDADDAEIRVIDQIGDDTYTSWLTNIGGTDTITATASGLAEYVTGQKFSFIAANANTGPATLNINSIGAKSLTKNGSTALVAGDIPTGKVVSVTYDGTRFQLDAPGINDTVDDALVVILQSGTGAVSRTQHQKNSEIVSVKDFGALGDGVADDGPAFQAALASAVRVHVPNGTYKLASTITLDSSLNYRELVGESRDGTIISYTGNSYPFVINSTDSSISPAVGIAIENMAIVGTASALGAIKLQCSRLCRFKRLHLHGFTNATAKIFYSDSTSDSSWGHNLEDIYINDSVGALCGFWINQYTHMVVSHCYVNTQTTYGFMIGSGMSMVLIDPAVDNLTTNGIVVTSGATDAVNGAPVHGLEIISPHIESFTGVGISFGGVIANSTNNGIYSASLRGGILTGQSGATEKIITVGARSYQTRLEDFSMSSPNTTATPMIEIGTGATETILENYSKTGSAGRSVDVSDTGTRTRRRVNETSYSVVWSSTGTQPAIGNGTLSGSYSREGNLCTVNIVLIAGSTTTFGTGQYRLSLPFVVASSTRAVGQFSFYDQSVSKSYSGICYADSSASLISALIAGANVYPMDLNNPVAIAASDRIDLTMTYPVA